MLRIGLTGGTGSGKSTVARRLAEHGAVVVDADVLAREVVAPGTDGLHAVVAEFGPQVLAADGGLDRAALAAVVFADPERRRALEGITHPLIARRTAELVAAAPDDAVLVHDVPLLVEKRMGARYHLVVVVDAPVEDRVRRLVARGMPEHDARRRIASQASDDQRRAAADVWLANAGGPDDLHESVDELWRQRLVPFRDHLAAARPLPLPVSWSAGPAAASGDLDEAAKRLVGRLRAALGERADGVEIGVVERADGERADGERADRERADLERGSGTSVVLDIPVLVRTGAVDASWDEPLLRAGFAPLVPQDGTGRAYGSCDPGRPAVLRLHRAG